VNAGVLAGISGRTRVFGLIGHPVKHSLSPAMHTTQFARLGLDAVYLGFDVHPDRADRVAGAIRTLDLAGVNLTAPFKERVIPHLDRLTIAAEEAGAVNVIVNVGGHLTGYNTDGEGLVQDLQRRLGWRPGGAICAVLGAGGAGRAVAASLGAADAQEVHLVNRTYGRAASACEHLARSMPHIPFRPMPLDPVVFNAAAPRFDLVVNCLGPGAEPLVRAFDIHALPSTAVWCDINYWMAEPPRMTTCAARGLRTLDGLGMLLHQGALSFELFTGHPVPVEALEAVAVGDQDSLP